MPTVSTGTTFAVSKKLPETLDESGFSVLTYTQIRGVRSVGDISEQHQTAQRNPIGSMSYQQRVGTTSSDVQLELYRIADAGQTMLRDAVKARTSYSYKLMEADGLVLYFTAGASSRTHGGITSGSLVDNKIKLDIDSKIIEV